MYRISSVDTDAECLLCSGLYAVGPGKWAGVQNRSIYVQIFHLITVMYTHILSSSKPLPTAVHDSGEYTPSLPQSTSRNPPKNNFGAGTAILAAARNVNLNRLSASYFSFWNKWPDVDCHWQ